jgi:hypothetical protein
MNTYAIFRLGIPYPTLEEIDLIMDISEDDSPAGAPIFPEQPGLSGVLSILRSKLSASEISNRFQRISGGLAPDKTIGDDVSVYPVMVFKIDSSNFSYNSDMSNFLDWGQTFKKFIGATPSTENTGMNNLSLDDLLDLVKSKGGFDKLTTEEQAMLKKLSQ